jgi:hypothetical protein
MFDWLFGARCPVTPERKAWLEGGLNWLGKSFGVQHMLGQTIVLPTPEFFPEPYDGSPAAVEAIFTRVCRYMEVSRDRVTLAIFDSEADRLPHFLREGRFEGAAGLYEADALGQTMISVDRAQLETPMSLVGTMAHELAHVHLLGDDRLSADSPDHEPLTDLLTVLYGLGIFTANAVIRESHWSQGVQSGWSVGRQGYLTGPEYGYALALLAQARSEPSPAWAAHLRLDVRSALKQGLRYLRSSNQSPFPGAATMGLASLPDDDVPWSRPQSAVNDIPEVDDLPPWARKRTQ